MEKENTENKEKLSERDKDLKRKNKFGSFIELLVKQMCRRATYEIDAAKFTNSIYSLNDPSSVIFSAKSIKAMHDNTKEGLVQLLQIKLFDEDTIQNVHGGNWLSNDNFSREQKYTLLRYLTTINHMAPASAQKWNDLQHYLHYIYRNFASPYPDLAGEQISPAFKNHMRDLFTSLLEEDESQLYLRMLALLREYCIFAHWHYCNHEDEHNITRLFYYYEAMLSAAKKIGSIFSEFEDVLRKNYSVYWIDFNTAVFLRYFFRTDMVQIKLRRALATGSSPGDTQAMFHMLDDLRNLWVKEEVRLKKINDEAAIKETVDYYYIEEAMINSHKKVLTWNFWIDRPRRDKNDLDLGRLDHHIFRLLADPSFCPAGPMLDRSGQCICEECTLAKYKYILAVEDKLVVDKEVKKFARLTFCRLCEGPVNLEKYHEHLNIHFSQKSSPADIGDPTNLSHIFSGKLSVDNDYTNFPSKGKNMRNTEYAEKPYRTSCDIHYGKLNIDNSYLDCLDCNDIARMEIEHFLRKRKDAVPIDTIRLNSSIRTYLRIKHGLFKETDKLVKAPSLASYKLAAATTSKVNWEHPCKHEEEDKGFGTCEDDMCDHQKEINKCDCTFCEMFGTSLSCQSYKHNELKEKLRIRLHQRREKRTKDLVKNPPPAAVVGVNNVATNVKMKTVINKVEERVPLPSSPTNIPPAPVVKSSESSVTSSGTDDIHGLVNYIEGVSGLNKIVRAQKKAAKKARQRQKKEEERMKIEEQKRIAEELKRMEEEKKELAKKIVEKENQVKNDSQILKAQLKKAKKERQAEKKKRMEEKGYTSVFEETIPAMVTIKRIAENGNNPTVTITLKGATPDQDKLLYALVMDAEVHKSKDSNETENVNSGSKNKKKQKKQNNSVVQPPEPSPKVITKELKVTVSLDSNTKTNQDLKKNKNTNKNVDNKNVDNKKPTTNNNKSKEVNVELKEGDLPMPMLRLPPGITITKVEGPVSKRNYKVNDMEEQKDSTINVGKSGVIVVDTEKLIQNKQSQSAAAAEQKSKTGKKTKRKKKKQNEGQVSGGSAKKMITLKNPIFQALQTKPPEPVSIEKSNDNCAPAAIFTNENGMVTIRSSRLQQSLSNSTTMPLMSLSNFLPEIKNQQSTNTSTASTTEQENNEISHFNAQEILSGLPGIEITKVDKFAEKPQHDLDKACQTAQVSIIPASNGVEKTNIEKDDWHYDNVFSPRDDLEDEMDDDELELEAFKRFCQQSVPPKRKEKVAHLNVADIVLKKKPDNFV